MKNFVLYKAGTSGPKPLPSLLCATLTMLFAIHTARAESAHTVHAAQLQAQAQSDAATVATLPENTKVEVLHRSGAWSEVKTAGGQSGWVRMLSLRFDSEAGQGSGASSAGNTMAGLSNLLSPARTSNNSTVAGGVRGLTEEDLQNAKPDPAELEKIKKFAVGKETAQNFAQHTKLKATEVDYLPSPAPAPVNQDRRER